MSATILASIPSPPFNGFWFGLVYIHFYGVMYVIGISLAVFLTRRRWRAIGGSPQLVDDLLLWVIGAGIVGARIYFDLTTPTKIPPHWWGPLAVWDGGLGIWGGVALAVVVGIWQLRRRGVRVAPFLDAVAPTLLIAQAIGRIGNYFNQELFGKPTTLPWALHVDPRFRPPGFAQYSTFHPTFLYELIFDLAWAGVLIWLGRKWVRPPGLFALYVAGYSAFRVFEETLRIDYSQYFFGLRLNFFVAGGMTVIGLAWFAYSQLYARRQAAEQLPVERLAEAVTQVEAGVSAPD